MATNREGHYLIDLHDTLINVRTGGALAGAQQLISTLRHRRACFRIATNATSKSRSEVAEDLTAAGLHMGPADVLTTPYLAGQYLAERGIRRVASLLREEVFFEELGEVVILDDGKPQAVIIGNPRRVVTDDELASLAAHVRRGAEFILLHRHPAVRDGKGPSPDSAGAHGARLSALTPGVRPVLLGKPSRLFFELCARVMSAPLSSITAVGDSPQYDVDGARAASVRAVLIDPERASDPAVLTFCDLIEFARAEWPARRVRPSRHRLQRNSLTEGASIPIR